MNKKITSNTSSKNTSPDIASIIKLNLEQLVKYKQILIQRPMTPKGATKKPKVKIKVDESGIINEVTSEFKNLEKNANETIVFIEIESNDEENTCIYKLLDIDNSLQPFAKEALTLTLEVKSKGKPL